VRGTTFAATLPEGSCSAREALVLKAVEQGYEFVGWSTIVSIYQGHRLEIQVSTDVLRIGDHEDSVRVAVTCRTMQLICDQLGCIMPTAKISDLIWQQALVKLSPHSQTPDSYMADTSRFVEHSDEVERELAGQQGLAAPIGKDFVLCKRLWAKKTHCANYGWQTKYSRFRGVIWGVRVSQPLGLCHSVDYTDYSQFCRLVKRSAVLDGKSVDLGEIYTDPQLAQLVSHEGALPGDRHPGVSAVGDTEDVYDTGEQLIIVVPPKLPTLRYGDKGLFVERFQDGLITCGHSLSPWGSDGDFGRLTLKRTKQFQRDEGLVADGVVGPITWAAMDAADDAPVDVSLLRECPLRPDFAPLIGTVARQQIFGAFKYRAEPTPSNPEAIEILDNWAATHIVEVKIPELTNVDGAPNSCEIYLHKAIAEQTKAMFAAWNEAGLINRLLTWHGSWVTRFIRGSTKTLSNHSFGSALDVNYQWNALGAEPADYGEVGCVRRLVPIAHEYGYYWGGHFCRADGCHLEAAKIL